SPTLVEQPVILLVGPEGGFSQEERITLTNHGGTNVSLGGRLLRTETAALAALALLNCI
ncbi:MAG: RsmE family RNA methyltransferase, partial [Magnetococcales bacterium]|nr:RsmE family RNA methyltransferase [Magnetococcales bacterium]